ncbi:MAG: RNA polymerase factor sigma-54 [Chitinophagaceae bacterium]|nr:RNA polymerase factor sigma-54 [Chitinophagaceae bacterium]
MMNQSLTQKQHAKILPQQIQLLNLFHLNTLELEQRITQEIQENPILEEADNDSDALNEKRVEDAVQDYQDWDEYGYDDNPDYKAEYAHYWHTEDIPQKPMVEASDFRKELKIQFSNMSSCRKEVELAEYLIDSLNNDGLLEQDLLTLTDDFSFKSNTLTEVDELETVLKKIQELDPVGIGARSINECFLLQLNRMNPKKSEVIAAICLVEKYFNDLHNRNMENILNKLHITEDELRKVLLLISRLKKRPVNTIAENIEMNYNIIPDFIISLDGENLEVSLHRQRSSSLSINRSWIDMIQDQGNDKKGADKATTVYLKNKLNSAQWFINAIRQREGTMLKVIKAIVSLQHEYFQEGDIKLLKPMILKNVAEIVGVDISTVSRICCNKYAETPFGTVLLKDLFTEGIENGYGDIISNRVIQSAVVDIIDEEDKKKPYTDQQLVKLLAMKGYNVARRTVAKYREQMKIPIAQMRGLLSY